MVNAICANNSKHEIIRLEWFTVLQFDSIGFDLSNPPELIVKILKATD